MDNCTTLEPYFALNIPYQVVLPSSNIPTAMAKAERDCKQNKQKFMWFLVQSLFVFIWEHRYLPYHICILIVSGTIQERAFSVVTVKYPTSLGIPKSQTTGNIQCSSQTLLGLKRPVGYFP